MQDASDATLKMLSGTRYLCSVIFSLLLDHISLLMLPTLHPLQQRKRTLSSFRSHQHQSSRHVLFHSFRTFGHCYTPKFALGPSDPNPLVNKSYAYPSGIVSFNSPFAAYHVHTGLRCHFSKPYRSTTTLSLSWPSGWSQHL